MDTATDLTPGAPALQTMLPEPASAAWKIRGSSRQIWGELAKTLGAGTDTDRPRHKYLASLVRSCAIRAREITMHRSHNPSSLSTLCVLAVLSLPAAAARDTLRQRAGHRRQDAPGGRRVHREGERLGRAQPASAVPALEGNLLNYIGEPNRFGLLAA